MRQPFRRIRRGVRVHLAAHERALLARLLEDVDGLLAEDAAEREAAAPAAGRAPGGRGAAEGGVPDGAGPASDDDVLAALEASLEVRAPADPAVGRLLPDGNRDDPDLAAGYRRMTEHGLRERKRAALGQASSALVRSEPVVLDDGEALALLKGLTDVRLVLAERLGLRTDEDAERLHAIMTADDLDPRAATAAVYDVLTWWQESLISTLR